jgi:hypothetical protein
MNNLHRRLRQIAFYENLEDYASQSSQASRVPVSSDETDTQGLDEGNLNNFEAFKHRNFKLKSKGAGPQGPLNLEAMILANELDFNKRPIYKPTRCRNLTQGEVRAMQALSQNHKVVIKPADKGQAMCVLNREDYLKEGYRQLSDSEAYQKVEGDLTNKHMKEVQVLVEEAYQNGEIHETVKEYLTDSVCKTPNLYLLPKIHKGKKPPPGRPVVSGNNGPTEKISQFVDHFLNPSVKDIKSYVKDTTHFLRLVGDMGEIPESSFLVTLDVAALYPSIPLDKGLQVARKALKRTRAEPGVKPSNKTLMTFLEAVLTKNNFTFNGGHYLQKTGTAIGTKVAPSFGNHFLNDFELIHVYTYLKQPLYWYRYIKDVFMVWPYSIEELNSFIEHLNSRLPTIRFTMEYSEVEIPFLDTLIKKKGRVLKTDLYSKPTDTFDYLLYNSSHPQTCKDSIPYSQFLRIRRICSEMFDYEKHVIEISKHFLRRNYPIELLEEAAILARQRDREILLEQKQKKSKNEGDKIFLVTTYHPSDNCLRDIVKQN